MDLKELEAQAVVEAHVENSSSEEEVEGETDHCRGTHKEEDMDKDLSKDSFWEMIQQKIFFRKQNGNQSICTAMRETYGKSVKWRAHMRSGQ